MWRNFKATNLRLKSLIAYILKHEPDKKENIQCKNITNTYKAYKAKLSYKVIQLSFLHTIVIHNLYFFVTGGQHPLQSQYISD